MSLQECHYLQVSSCAVTLMTKDQEPSSKLGLHSPLLNAIISLCTCVSLVVWNSFGDCTSMKKKKKKGLPCLFFVLFLRKGKNAVHSHLLVNEILLEEKQYNNYCN